MFRGEYNHTIDTKGRLIVPAKFREILGESFVITKGLEGCLSIYNQEGWKDLEEQLSSLPSNRDTRQIVRFFSAGAADVELDKQGRILIPANLREFAGLDKDVVLTGVIGHIEVWDKERWEGETVFDNMEDVAERVSEMGLRL